MHRQIPVAPPQALQQRGGPDEPFEATAVAAPSGRSRPPFPRRRGRAARRGSGPRRHPCRPSRTRPRSRRGRRPTSTRPGRRGSRRCRYARCDRRGAASREPRPHRPSSARCSRGWGGRSRGPVVRQAPSRRRGSATGPALLPRRPGASGRRRGPSPCWRRDRCRADARLRRGPCGTDRRRRHGDNRGQRRCRPPRRWRGRASGAHWVVRPARRERRLAASPRG